MNFHSHHFSFLIQNFFGSSTRNAIMINQRFAQIYSVTGTSLSGERQFNLNGNLLFPHIINVWNHSYVVAIKSVNKFLWIFKFNSTWDMVDFLEIQQTYDDLLSVAYDKYFDRIMIIGNDGSETSMISHYTGAIIRKNKYNLFMKKAFIHYYDSRMAFLYTDSSTK